MAKNDRSPKRAQIKNKYDEINREDYRREEMARERFTTMREASWLSVDPRRRQEWADGGMVNEDRNAMANLSNQPVHRQFPEASHALVYTPQFADNFFSNLGD